VTFRIIETSGQEGFGQIPNERATEHVRAEADHVHVVVFHVSCFLPFNGNICATMEQSLNGNES